VRLLLVAGFVVAGMSLATAHADAATLFLSPSQGANTTDSTFTVSIVVNTEGEFVNALDLFVAFPAGKLQVVSPSTGSSIISIWTSQPSFDNLKGTLHFQGGIPNPGINTQHGVISTITFRMKVVGPANVRFLDNSKVLLNDGKGTDVLRATSGGLYVGVLPPPAGPIVSSPTHPDQGLWYSDTVATFDWANEAGVEGYSYVLNDEPAAIPDDISEGVASEAVYENMGSGRHYFHVKAFKGGVWGGVTHYAVLVDAEPPADFPVKISPGERTTSTIPIINFQTTDTLSGLDFYEIKIVRLDAPNDAQAATQDFFVEATSPYTPELAIGKYELIVRAYDRAGNVREETKRLSVVTPLFQVIGPDGIEIDGQTVLPWSVAIGGSITLAVLLGAAMYVVRRWHARIGRGDRRALPADVRRKLKRLQELESKYTHSILLIVLGAALLLGAIAGGDNAVAAQQEGRVGLSSPLVVTVSKNISNEEIFYIGGRTETANGAVIIYLQNIETRETYSFTTQADGAGEWFYTHTQFLNSGEYVLWTQARRGEEVSPPSAQIQLNVFTTALRVGSFQVGFDTLFIALTGLFSALVVVLAVLLAYHVRKARNKRNVLLEEILEAEQAVREGFAELRKVIQEEYEQHTRRGAQSSAAQERERELLADLEEIQQHIGEEVLDIEQQA
jgi:hypothetical protein